MREDNSDYGTVELALKIIAPGGSEKAIPLRCSWERGEDGAARLIDIHWLVRGDWQWMPLDMRKLLLPDLGDVAAWAALEDAMRAAIASTSRPRTA